MKTLLCNVSIVIIDTLDQERASRTLLHCNTLCENEGCYLFTDIDIENDSYQTVKIDKIKNNSEYSHFMIKEFVKYLDLIESTHILIIQHDGWILNPNKRIDEFTNYDYIGAPFGNNLDVVGNGGFSLRSKKLFESLNRLNIRNTHPEDGVISYTSRRDLINDGIKFAPLEVAKKTFLLKLDIT
jgi:hypothetical protein